MTEKTNKVVIAVSRVVKISVRITEVVGQETVSDTQPRLCTALDAPPVYVYICVFDDNKKTCIVHELILKRRREG